MRILLALAVVLAGCGTVCDGAVAAEQGANQKSSGCNAGAITVHDAMKCNEGSKTKCTSNDLNGIQKYGSCLNALPVCTSDNQQQFSSTRQGCINQAAADISLTCFSAIL